MSIDSHKSSPRTIQVPQRSNGRARVAAILEAAAAVFAEKGYDGATMAEIAERSGTKIGSLYRFFPNKESLADTIVVSARERVDALFDRFDADATSRSPREFVDVLLALLFDHFRRPALVKLLDAGHHWSVRREEFRSAILQRAASALRLRRPTLSAAAASDIALVVVLTVKTIATHQASFEPGSQASKEFHEMTRSYLESKLT